MTRCPDMSALLQPFDRLTWAHLRECSACLSLARIGAGHGGDDTGAMTEMCAEVEPLLAVVPATALDTGDRDRVERHLGECARCAAVAATLCLDLGVGAAEPQPHEGHVTAEAAPALAATRMRAPFRGAVEVAALKRRHRWRMTAAAIAAACVAVGVTALLKHRGPGEPAGESAQRTAWSVSRGRREAASGGGPGQAAGSPRRPARARVPARTAGAAPARRHAKPPRAKAAHAKAARAKALASAGPVPRRLSRADIRRGIDAIRGQVRQCADKRQTSREVEVVVKFRIAPWGRVTRATARPDNPLGRCVARAVKKAHFPPAELPLNVRYPFVFTGPPPPAAHRPRARPVRP